MKFLQLLQSKTVIGVAATQIPGIISALVSKDWNHLVTCLGVILAGAGLRDAIHKGATLVAGLDKGAQGDV